MPFKARITARAAYIRNPTHPSIRSYPGRASIKAKTHALHDMVVVVLRGSGLTPLEQTMMDSPDTRRAERVVAMREDFQRMMAKRHEETIEQLTDRKVLAFLSKAHVAPDVTLEIFVIDQTLDGFGALGVIDRQQSSKVGPHQTKPPPQPRTHPTETTEIRLRGHRGHSRERNHQRTSKLPLQQTNPAGTIAMVSCATPECEHQMLVAAPEETLCASQQVSSP